MLTQAGGQIRCSIVKPRKIPRPYAARGGSDLAPRVSLPGAEREGRRRRSPSSARTTATRSGASSAPTTRERSSTSSSAGRCGSRSRSFSTTAVTWKYDEESHMVSTKTCPRARCSGTTNKATRLDTSRTPSLPRAWARPLHLTRTASTPARRRRSRCRAAVLLLG